MTHVHDATWWWLMRTSSPCITVSSHCVLARNWSVHVRLQTSRCPCSATSNSGLGIPDFKPPLGGKIHITIRERDGAVLFKISSPTSWLLLLLLRFLLLFLLQTSTTSSSKFVWRIAALSLSHTSHHLTSMMRRSQLLSLAVLVSTTVSSQQFFVAPPVVGILSVFIGQLGTHPYTKMCNNVSSWRQNFISMSSYRCASNNHNNYSFFFKHVWLNLKTIVTNTSPL